MKAFTFTLFACWYVSPSVWAATAEKYQETLHSALSLIDPDAAVDLAIKDIDVGFIDYLMDQAKAGHSENVILCALVTQKFVQFKAEISAEKKEQIVEFLTTQPPDTTPNTIVCRLEYLAKIDHPKVRNFAQQFVNNPEASVQFYVRKITSDHAAESQFPNESSPRRQNDNSPQAIEGSKGVESTESASMFPTWRWLAAIFCALGISIALLVKAGRRNRHS
jgi:hypothetical protein